MDATSDKLSTMVPTPGMVNALPKPKRAYRRKPRWVFTQIEDEVKQDGLPVTRWKQVKSGSDRRDMNASKKVIIPEYTDAEYDKNLASATWTKEETDHLFEVCRRFELSWILVTDRWDRHRFGVKTMEDLKERFYWIFNELNVVRKVNTETIHYDAQSERIRKEQLNKQWNRTTEEIDEQKLLLKAMKKMEAGKRKLAMLTQDRQKLAALKPASHSSARSRARSQVMAKETKSTSCKRARSAAKLSAFTESLLTQLDEPQLRFSEFKAAGAHFQSREMKLHTNVGQRKIETLNQVVQGLKLEIPHATPEYVAAFNEFRSDVIVLQELKLALQKAESELECMNINASAVGRQMIEIEPRIRVSDGAFDEALVGTEGGPTSTRTITRMIDLEQSTPQWRKRKATTFPGVTEQ
ncbi:hypothetical protein L596_006545 [Steinernema carpocapsae]|uniref:Myb-like domain-containing protein n=1 Tax=Steinernema carpocapsae TaxID=34508 RepID=A0A4U8V4Y3_STECR|nr:hypothetical protein L596_006545 [Steinernema carpocapsae]